jgi:hypothetical protein
MEQITLTPNAIYWILFIGIALASWLVSAALERKFKRYQKVALKMTGKEVAEKMLRDNDIYDVKVTCVQGRLTDHYNPTDKTVNLSQDVYSGASVAAAAVAAHECGHAVQHSLAYGPLSLRSALVPVVSFSSRWVTWIILGGLLLIDAIPHTGQVLMLIGIVLYATLTLFSLITLPVEINASQRAVNWLREAGITDNETTAMASDALRSAAYTYVVAALSSLATLVYYILIFMGGSRR